MNNMEHNIHDGIIGFKSLTYYYGMERAGAKANTLRVVTEEEYNDIVKNAPGLIEITDIGTGELFAREISSIVMIPPVFCTPVERDRVLILISWWS